MSETTARNVFAELEAFEAAAFRIGQLARSLRTGNPDLPVETMEPTLWSFAGSDGPQLHITLELVCGSTDDACAWAKALDVEAAVTTSTTSPTKQAAAQAVIGGVTVKVSGLQSLTADEYTVWKADRDQAAVATSAGGGE
ncbi:hypothetical protein [Streptomyces scabiei]|uniref:hypothetical protein n=1 Tax=Streptomyces scabiei TaxID=1930 RepID=UPI000765CF55|nr:hypothetical protein [Streptomyces scabiei]